MEGKKTCKTIDVCCDYAVCERRLTERFGVEAEPVEVARWICGNLIDLQGEAHPECDGCPGEER